MSNHTIAWFEILGRDLEALRGYYGELFGWRAEKMPGMDYATVDCEQSGVPGGLGANMGDADWTTFYVTVESVDGALERAIGLGGSVAMPARDLPDGGRIAVFRDPEGHPVGLVQEPAAQ